MTNKSVEVIFVPKFLRMLKKLSKRYPHIRADLDPLLHQLRQGETPGDQMQNVGYRTYKVRLPNRDAKRGKSGGYRVVYFVELADSVQLIAIYSKSDAEDMAADEITRIIEESNPPG